MSSETITQFIGEPAELLVVTRFFRRICGCAAHRGSRLSNLLPTYGAAHSGSVPLDSIIHGARHIRLE